MRKLLVFLTPFLLLPGCLSDDGDSGSDTDMPEENTPMTNATLEPLHWEGDILVGADPFNFIPVVGGVCSQDVSTCFYHDFTVPGNQTVNLEATLAWGLAANDLDLYLYQGSQEISSDGINSLGGVPPEVPTASQIMRVPALPAGAYTFWVVAWNAAGESYTLDATFDA